MPARRSRVGGGMHVASVKTIDANKQLTALTEKSIGWLLDYVFTSVHILVIFYNRCFDSNHETNPCSSS